MHFNKKVNVVRVTQTPGIGESGTETESTAIANLPCRIVQAKGNEEIKFGGVVHVVNLKLYCAIVDILQEDRITYAGDTYEVLNIKPVEHASQSFYKVSLGLAK